MYSFTLSLVFLALISVACCSAQEDSAGILALHPPSEEEQTAPGSEKFVIHGLEDGVATIWEYLPGEAEFTKRVSLVKSHWVADELFYRGEVHPNLLRLQVPAQRGYRVSLYDVDYRRWQVRRIQESRQIHGMGPSGDSVYLKTDKGIRLMDLATSELSKPARKFERLRTLGALWLIRFLDDGSGAIFDPIKRQVRAHFDLPALAQKEHGISNCPWVELSPDGNFLGMALPLPSSRWPKFGELAIEVMHMIILDLETGKTQSFSTRALMMGGSGIPVIHLSLSLGFDEYSRFHYLCLSRGAEPKPFEELAEDGQMRTTYVDLRTMEQEYVDYELEPAPPRIRFLPEYLREKKPKRELELMAAFLEHHGIPQAFVDRESGGSYHCPSSFSSDGKRFLARLRITEKEWRFYYGDLEKNQLVEVDGKGVSIPGILCVATPD